MITLIFPHQLFAHHPALHQGVPVMIVEEYLFFSQYRFHKSKLVFHRASMKFYASFIQSLGYEVRYIDSQDVLHDIRMLVPELAINGFKEIHFCDPVDNWLEKRIYKSAKLNGVEVVAYQSPSFLNSKEEIKTKLKNQKQYFQTSFYIAERKERMILLDSQRGPLGGQWSFDAENRKSWPKNKKAPVIHFPEESAYLVEATEYVNHHFPGNPGNIPSPFPYPINFHDSEIWMHDFVNERLNDFGPYEDALVMKESILNHSLLSPLINAGLLLPSQVLEAVLAKHSKDDVHLPSIEGFVRQLIGWREFIRGIYELEGSNERIQNYFSFTRSIPPAFYQAETGILPFDSVLEKVLNTAYAHHIERLMVLGNFMLLCEFNPDEVYQWFMELFIDAYDWVMVPNIYGMSQFADGGLMSTKPYISGSNYLNRMGDFPDGNWQMIWNALYWRFIHVHRVVLKDNHRMQMIIATFDKMNDTKKSQLLEIAEGFLAGLDSRTTKIDKVIWNTQ